MGRAKQGVYRQKSMMAAEQYQYARRLSGIVKAYKQMTCRQARELNRELEKRGTCGR